MKTELPRSELGDFPAGNRLENGWWTSRPIALMLAIAWLAASGILVGCSDAKFVPIPLAQSDQAPVITISIVVVGGSAVVDKLEVSSSDGPTATVAVEKSGTLCEIPTLVILAGAKNLAGGVKEFKLHIARGPNLTTVYDVTATATQNDAGLVPVSLSILGHDNSGGTGGEPLLVAFDGGTLGCPTSDTYVVTATARNFNNQSTALTETISAQLSSAGCICE